MRRYGNSYDIAPSTQWIILHDDGYGARPMIDVKKHKIESYEDAKEVADYYKRRYPSLYGMGKIIIKEVPYEDVWGDIYNRGAHGGRRYKFTPEQRKKIREEQEESDSYGPPYTWFPPLSDEEIEGRSLYYIGKNAARNEDGTYDIDRAKAAIKEYREGIRDRKKKTSKSPKRNIAKKAGDKLHSMYTVPNFGSNAGSKLESIYRVKKTSKSPKRKVTRKSK
jgi:hypothetical protein